PPKPAPIQGLAVENRVFGRGTVELRRSTSLRHHTNSILNGIAFAALGASARPIYLRLALCVLTCISITARDDRRRFTSNSAKRHFSNSAGRHSNVGRTG
ncbi:hypothetical protein, partial [Caballeronia calidae]|uniref:hypothetical protein n=1 Tax=Caballeronia calidae TaxID=1777139 RepID=UPI001E55FC6A